MVYKFQLIAEGMKIMSYSGKRYSSIGTIYKATFLNKQKAIRKANALKKEHDLTGITIKKYNPKDAESYRSGRQMSSGVYYTGSREVSYIPNSAKKEVYSWHKRGE